MTELRDHWKGVSLPGDIVLGQWLGGDENAGFFQSWLGPDKRRAVVRVVREASVADASQLDHWLRTRQLCHLNLLELLDCGRADLSGEIVLYAVFESPDDTLAAALSRSPLNAQEAREVLDSVLDALRYLHAQGMVVGTLDADHIVAVGDRIKLSTDGLRPAADASAYAEDIRRLGEFWKQSLMPASPKSAEIAARASDPNPQTRWSLDQISAALTAPAMLPPPKRQSAAAPGEPAVPYHFPKWIIVGAAALLLLILGLNLRRPSETATAPSTVAPVAAPVTAPVAPPAAAPVAPAPVAPPERKPSPIAGREKWRVIAFTYRTREAASKKVKQLNQDHPDLHATIFSPKKSAMFLVALGGPMTRESAVRVQRTAKGKGLPRDLYVQNYSEP